MKNLDLQIQKLIERNTKKFVEINKKKCYEENIFSDMSDWNPAEILGNNPNSMPDPSSKLIPLFLISYKIKSAITQFINQSQQCCVISQLKQ